MTEQHQRGRGGDVRRKAPPGYYTGQQARTLLNMPKMTFYRRVREGLIKRVTIPGIHDGYYAKEEIDLLVSLREEGIVDQSKLPSTIFRRATPEDASDIVTILTSLGWQTTTPELRQAWYAINPDIDHVVVQNGIIMGYINTIPYREAVMERMIRGEIKSWDTSPEDILPFEAGGTYDLFFGLAERKKPHDKPGLYARYGMRLILGFRAFLMDDLYLRNIRIRRVLGQTDEEDGRKVANVLGFALQPPDPRDRYPIYILDMEHADAPWVQRYRALWEKGRTKET